MNILQRANYAIFFDDVQVDEYVTNWNVRNGLFANDATANITLFRTPAMDKWKGYLVQVKIFAENPFTKKYTMLFDGEIMNRSWNDSRSSMGQVTFQAKGYYHWLDIQIPMAIQANDEYDPLLRFIYEAQNINIDEVRTFIMSSSESSLKDKSIKEIIDQLFEKLTLGYYEVGESDTAFAFAKIKERFKVMVEVLPDFRKSGFLDLFTFTNSTQMNSFFVYLNEVLSQLMFEFYQDRDGTFRIKTPSWSDELMKAHIIDSSIVESISGLDDWENEPTRVLAIGGETQFTQSLRNQGVVGDQTISNVDIPLGLYIGNPQNPDTEEYFSGQIKMRLALEAYGATPLDYGASGSFNGEWFDNLTDNYKVTSGHKSVNSGRPTHNGTDYNLRYEPVYNIGTYGKVIQRGYHDSMGYYVTIEQNIEGRIYTFRYMHFREMAVVNVGDSVSPGALLGTSGSTGHSTGPHLHFEIWAGKTNVGPTVNPVDFLKARKNSTSSGRVYAGPGGPQQITGTSSYTPSASTTAGTPMGGFEITAYTAFCDTGCIGITKEGWNVKDNTIDHRVIAVDPTVIPLGSIVEVGSFGLFNAVDTGGAIKGKRIDILVHNTSYAFKVGRQHNIPVKVLRSGYGDKSRVPASAIGTFPSWNGVSSSGGTGETSSGGTGISRSYSSPYANVDGVAIGFKPMETTGFTTTSSSKSNKNVVGGVDTSNPKAVTYSTKDKGTIPSYAKDYESAINNNTGGISPRLIAAVIQETSEWREKFSDGARTGLMGIPVNYANAVLPGKNLLDGNNSINFGSDFLKNAMARFKGKVTLGLAAYYLGDLTIVEKATKDVGVLDFSKIRNMDSLAGAVSFVDSVIAIYTEGKGNYISGDPHVGFGKKLTSRSGARDVDGPNSPTFFDVVESEDSALPDYEAAFQARLSDEEKKYKVNLIRVEQALIRADAPGASAGDGMSADRLIYQYAKYNMQLHRAKTHNVNISLSTCLPFIRPGYNAWIEPTRSDVVCYITAVQHQGSFQNGCRTSLSGGFVRQSTNYQDVDSSIFIGETLADSSVFGETANSTEMQKIKAELEEMHKQGVTGEAQDFSVLNKLYKSMNGNSLYTTKWNKEYTRAEISSIIKGDFKKSPSVVKERKGEVKKAFDESKDMFLKFLLMTKN